MQRIIDAVLWVLLTSTLYICIGAIEGPPSEGHYIYWMGLASSFLGLGALALSIIVQLKEELK